MRESVQLNGSEERRRHLSNRMSETDEEQPGDA